MRTVVLVCGVLVGIACGARGESPRLGRERIILRTEAGDIVLALYPGAAPEHVKQILHLARLGVFDTSDFCQVHPDFVAQISSHEGRREPLADQQRAAIYPLPAEFSQSLKHRRGTLSMARADREPDSAETSFCIMLADAPHLDGSYTIFGQVESGMEVVDEFLRIPTERPAQAGDVPSYRPVVRIEITRAEVVDSPEEFSALKLAAARPIPYSPAAPDDPNEILRLVNGMLIVALIAMVFTGVSAFFLSKKLSAQRLMSLQLIAVLIGSFMLYVVLTPIGHTNPNFAALLFLALLGLFRLMGKFEGTT